MKSFSSRIGQLVSIALCTASVCSAQYGPDPTGVPADFMCGWRTLVFNASKAIRPDAEMLVYDALQLGHYCPHTARPVAQPLTWPTAFWIKHQFSSGTARSLSFPHSNTDIYVDCDHGSDSNSGTKASPLKTLQKGVDMGRQSSPGNRSVFVRRGTCYLQQPLILDDRDSGLTLSAYPGEEVWISGGVPLQAAASDWKRVGNSKVWSLDLSSLLPNLDGIASLRANGARINPARFPNANPETEFWPAGYLTSTPKFVPDGSWLQPKISPHPNPAKTVSVATRPWDSYFSNYSGGAGGTCAIYDPPFSFWCSSVFSPGCGGCFTWNIPAGVQTGTDLVSRPGYPYNDPTDVVFMAWRAAHWANWAFEVDALHANGTVDFGRGGFQGARGGPGSDWFVQNVFEELDVADEFYFNKTSQTLYVVSNETAANSPPSAQYHVVAPTSHVLINATGSRSKPIKGLTLVGLGFRDSAWTMLQPHGVPSGGDWALERTAAVFVQGTTGFKAVGCNFTRLGGNALMLSKRNMNATIEQSSFEWLGGSAIAAWGYTDELSDGGIHGSDGTGGDFPRYTLVQENLFREIGIWEKQSSAFFQAKTAQTTLRSNVVFNLARAGFNFNDGFGGGDVVHGNVLFNTCRESSDHGPINSWDRQPFVTTIRNGQPSSQMEWREVYQNILISNYGGSKEIDNDDGSLFWRNHDNVMVYGWGQKFKCGGIHSYGNLKAFIDLGGKLGGEGCLENRNSGVFEPNLWHNDIMVALDSSSSSSSFVYRECWGQDNEQDFDKTRVYNNTIYVKNKQVAVKVEGGACTKGTAYTFAEWKQKGEDPGTQLLTNYPSSENIIAWAQAILASP